MKLFTQYQIKLSGDLTVETVSNQLNHIHSIMELRAYLDGHPFTLEATSPPFGCMRPEHMLKCFAAADRFGCSDLIPDYLGLRDLWQQISGKAKPHAPVDSHHVFATMISHLKPSPRELCLLMEKMSLEQFLMLDAAAEDAVCLLNFMEGVRTRQSCAGHADALRYFAGSNLSISLDDGRAENTSLVSRFKQHVRAVAGDNVKITFKQRPGGLDIFLFQVPPDAWIKEHGSRPLSDVQKSLENLLQTGFNFNPYANSEWRIAQHTPVEVLDHLRWCTWQCVNRLNTALDPDTEKDAVFWDLFRPVCLTIENTYKAYYLSQAAQKLIGRFWQAIRAVAQETRCHR